MAIVVVVVAVVVVVVAVVVVVPAPVLGATESQIRVAKTKGRQQRE